MENNNSNKNNGKIEIFCGPMYSGKTEEVLRRLERLYHAKINYAVFKLKKDARYSEDRVVSHAKKGVEAVNVETALDILTYCNKNPDIKHIAIDEIQFLPVHDSETGQPLPFNAFKLCKDLKHRGYTIYASGLDMDFKGDPFGIMPQLLAIADEIHKLKAVCFRCGAMDASFSGKLSDSDAIEDIGEKDKYEALCYTHWLENISNRKKRNSP